MTVVLADEEQRSEVNRSKGKMARRLLDERICWLIIAGIVLSVSLASLYFYLVILVGAECGAVTAVMMSHTKKLINFFVLFTSRGIWCQVYCIRLNSRMKSTEFFYDVH